jgi:hypothetical protein
VSPFSSSAAPAAAASSSSSSSKIADWATLNHVELIHRQGLQAPPIVFQITEDPDDEVYLLVMGYRVRAMVASIEWVGLMFGSLCVSHVMFWLFDFFSIPGKSNVLSTLSAAS